MHFRKILQEKYIYKGLLFRKHYLNDHLFLSAILIAIEECPYDTKEISVDEILITLSGVELSFVKDEHEHLGSISQTLWAQLPHSHRKEFLRAIFFDPNLPV